MGVMEFREPNQVLWRGVRPAHNGTQIAKDKTITNGTAIVHTVTAAKTFFLTAATFSVFGSAAAQRGELFVRDADDLNPYLIFLLGLGAAGHFSEGLPFNPPLEIPAGYDVCIFSNDANLGAAAFIHGWEE